jgi:hypothetical protein
MDRKQPESNPVQALRPTHLSMRREVNCNRHSFDPSGPCPQKLRNKFSGRPSKGFVQRSQAKMHPNNQSWPVLSTTMKIGIHTFGVDKFRV